MHSAVLSVSNRRPRTMRFLRHLGEMTLAMMVGMMVGGVVMGVTLATRGMTWEEGLLRYPELLLLGMAVSMTVPMVAWMRHRGHGWRSSSEMTAAMFVPAILFICLVWLHVTEGAMCGLYCLSTIPAMVVVMLYRVDDYSEPHLVNAASAPAS